MGDKWAAENGIVRGVTDPMQKPPPEWIAATKRMVVEGRGSSNADGVNPDSAPGQASTTNLEPLPSPDHTEILRFKNTHLDLNGRQKMALAGLKVTT